MGTRPVDTPRDALRLLLPAGATEQEQDEQRKQARALRQKARAVLAGTATFSAEEQQRILAAVVIQATR